MTPEGEAAIERLHALVARGQALQATIRERSTRLTSLLPESATDVAVAEMDDRGILTALTFVPGAAERCTPVQIEHAVNVAISRARPPVPVLGAQEAAGLLVAVAAGGLPSPSVHVSDDGLVAVTSVAGQVLSVRVAPELVETSNLVTVARVIVGTCATAVRDGGRPTAAAQGDAADE